MADFDKVVDKLTETNKSLAALESQGIAAGGIKSIIAQSLPEVVNERNLAKKREIFDDKERITKVDDEVKLLTGEQSKTNDILLQQGTFPSFADLQAMLPPPEGVEKAFAVGFANLDFSSLNFGNSIPKGKQEEDAKSAALVAEKQQALLEKISNGIMGLKENAKAKVAAAGKGLMALLKGTLLAGFLFAFGKFLQSETFQNLLDYIKDTIIPFFIKFKDLFIGLGVFLVGLKIAPVIMAIIASTKALQAKYLLEGSLLKGLKVAMLAKLAALKTLLVPLLPIIAIAAGITVLFFAIKSAFTDFQKTLEETGSVSEALKVGAAKFLGFILGFIPDLVLKLVGFVAGLFGFDDFKAKVGKLDPIQFIADGIKSLFDAIGNFFSDIFNFDYTGFLKGIPGVGKVLSFLGMGDDSKDQPLEGRAEGGSVGTGQPYVVGERGQELFVPNQPGQIVNAQRTAEMMKGGSGGNGGGSTSIVVAPTNISSSNSSSTTSSGVSYIGNPDPIFQRASSYAI